MRGEELEGLSVEELQQLEKNLEAGLHRVLQTKVWRLSVILLLSGFHLMSNSFIGFIIVQDQQFLEQISELQRKVWIHLFIVT